MCRAGSHEEYGSGVRGDTLPFALRVQPDGHDDEVALTQEACHLDGFLTEDRLANLGARPFYREEKGLVEVTQPLHGDDALDSA